jgi:hypothetical protein
LLFLFEIEADFDDLPGLSAFEDEEDNFSGLALPGCFKFREVGLAKPESTRISCLSLNFIQKNVKRSLF